MNRLFWKFFGFFLLAQILTTTVVMTLFWFRDSPHLHRYNSAPPVAMAPMMPNGINPPVLAERPIPSPRFPLRPIFIGIFSSLLFAFLLARYFSKPIVILKKGFSEIGKGNFDVSIAKLMKGRNDELADLGRDFDQTATHLKNLIDGQKRLLSDVSHEVRSPLTRMLLAIDLLERRPERSVELIARVAKESNRINSLMDQVLDLARLETNIQWDMKEVINLKELINIIIQDVSFEADEKNSAIKFNDQTTSSASIIGNQELLHRAIENVLRNAVRFTKPNTSVEIRLSDIDNDWNIRIIDQGPGVSNEKLDQIFQPFNRAGNSSDHGYGLGLAIVYQTLKLHKGNVTATNVINENQSGLCVTLSIPKLAH